MVQVYVNAVIGYEQIRPSVIVIIRSRNREVLPVGLKELRGFRNVGKRPVAIIVIEHSRSAFVHGGSAARLNVYADDAGPLASRTKLHIPTYVQIEIAVAVVIEKGCACVEHGSEIRAVDMRLLSDIRERAISIIAVQDVLTVLRD